MKDVISLENKDMVNKIKEQFNEAKKILNVKSTVEKFNILENVVKNCSVILNEVANEEVFSEKDTLNIIKYLKKFNDENENTNKMTVFGGAKSKCHLVDISEAFAVKIGPFYCKENPTSVIMSDVMIEPQMSLVFDEDYNHLFLSEKYITEDNEDLGDKRVDHFLNVTEITLMNLTNDEFLDKLIKNFDKEALLNFIGSNFPSMLFSISKN